MKKVTLKLTALVMLLGGTITVSYAQNKINVVTFQHMIKTPIAIPIMAALIEFTFPKYSGAKNKALAPKVFIKPPSAILKRMNQKTSSTWYFRKCRNTSCMGSEKNIPLK